MKGFRTFGDLPDEAEAPPVLPYRPPPPRRFPWNAMGLYLALAGLGCMAWGMAVPARNGSMALTAAIIVGAALAVFSSIQGALSHPPMRDTRSRIARYVGCILGSLLLGFGLVVIMDANRHPRAPADRAKCANHLRQIALASIMYASQDPHGRYPATPNLILETQDITSDVFVCPASSDTRAAGPTTQAIAANLTAGGHFSYVYLGAGFTMQSDPRSVLLYEPTSLHNGTQNFVYLDAHVESHPTATAAKIIAELNAGHNPPRPEKVK